MPSRQQGPMEIERVYLLRGMPPLPASSEALGIEQGYLPGDAPEPGEASLGEMREGRVRRITHPDGRIECVHTTKTGAGRVRTEVERPITIEEFERAWPGTDGRRIRKTRHRVRHGSLVWEIDAFDDLDLVLAEVELPAPDAPVELPPWLAPHVVREVTDEPEYRNYSLALKAGAMPRPRR